MTTPLTSTSSSNYLTLHKKQIIILSGAGKPVFARYPSFGEDGLAICALLRAICSKTHDQLTLIQSTETDIIFQNQIAGITLICITDINNRESIPYIDVQLDCLFKHILFHTTKPALVALFDNEPSFDLSGLLSGTEGEALELIYKFHYHFHLMLMASPSYYMPFQQRKIISDILDEAIKGETQAIFAIMLAPSMSSTTKTNPIRDESIDLSSDNTTNQKHSSSHTLSSSSHYYNHHHHHHSTTNKTTYSLIASRSALMKSYKIPPPLDMLLLCNFVELRAPQLASGGETWTPLCLPEYDSSGNFHVYVAQIDDITKTVLLLLMENASLDHFHRASTFKTSLANRYQTKILPFLNNNVVTTTTSSTAATTTTTSSKSSLLSIPNILDVNTGISYVIHILVRAMARPNSVPQYFETDLGNSTDLPIEVQLLLKNYSKNNNNTSTTALKKYKKYLVRRYATVLYDLHHSNNNTSTTTTTTTTIPNADTTTNTSSKLTWNATPQDIVLIFGNLQDEVLIAATFTPFTSKAMASTVITRVRTFIEKEMLNLFY
jgi:ABC-type transporter MlaC component